MLSKCFLAAITASVVLGLVAAVQAKDEAEYTAEEAAKHIGETATVTAKVEDTYQAKGGNVFLNLGGKHPNETFTVFVPASAASEFKDVKSYEGKTISVTGKIEDHKGKPEIAVKLPADITVKGDDQSSAPSASPSATVAAKP